MFTRLRCTPSLGESRYLWSLSYTSGCSVIENVGATGSYRYLTKALTSCFSVNSSPFTRPVQLWKELPADYSTTPGGLIGDVDLYGTVNAADALLLLRHVMNIELLSNRGLYNGDVDRSGSVNMVDCLNILRCAMNAIDSF